VNLHKSVEKRKENGDFEKYFFFPFFPKGKMGRKNISQGSAPQAQL